MNNNLKKAPPHILAIEDRAEDLYLLETMLKGGGYRVTAVQNGRDAYEALPTGAFDLIVSDILMPEMDGYQLCAKVKADERLKGIPFVFLTATYMTESDETFAVSLGADRFLRKPVDMDVLLATVAELLREAAENTYTPKKPLEAETFSKIHVQYVLHGLEKKSSELEYLFQKQKETEEALRKNEARYRRISSLASDYFYQLSVTQEGRWHIDWIGGAFEAITGYDPDKIKDMDDWLAFTAPEDVNKVREKFPQLLAGHSTQIEYRIICVSGDIRWLTDYNEPLLDDEHRVIGAVGAVKDITHEKMLERQLRESRKMEAIGTLAGGIAHDFNNILSAIIGFTELSLDDLPPDGVLRENLQEVLKGGHRAKDLVHQILTFARRTEKEYRPIMVKPLVKEALKMLRASIPSTIEFRSNIAGDRLIQGDPTEIYQIVMNLCANAAHAMEEKGGLLTISLTDKKLSSRDLHGLSPDLKPGRFLNLRVSDTGCGMAPNVVDRIFEPFFTTKEQGQGTGMGLSVVHGIVKSHGGDIRVISKPGEGSTFNVYFPCIEAPAPRETDQEKTVPRGTERILFVDDDEAIVKLTQRNLESLGYRVWATQNSEKALEMVRSHPERFDLVITDMTMPQMTGDVLAQKILSIRSDLPVILCTGYSKKINREKAMGMGILAFLEKPVLKPDLAHAVRGVLDKASSNTSTS